MIASTRTLAVLILLANAVASSALPVDQYLKIRRRAGFDPSIAYRQVAASPGTYVGRVFEMRGKVEGFIRRDQTFSFLLSLAEKGSVLLDCPAADVDLVVGSNHQMLRVLARVDQNDTGNVVPLQVLGVAYDAEVSSREREAAGRVQAQADAQVFRRMPDRQTYSRPSRGYTARRMASAGWGLSALAARYLSPEAQAIYPAYKSYICRCNTRLTTDELDTITVSILHFSQRYHVDPRLVIAMIIAESDFDPRSTSNKGAMGLAQLMPDEARNNHLTNPYDPVQNVGTAIGLLRDKLDRYRTESLPDGQYTLQQIQLALAAYNAGPGAVRKYGGVPPYRETQGYIKRIMRIYSELIKG